MEKNQDATRAARVLELANALAQSARTGFGDKFSTLLGEYMTLANEKELRAIRYSLTAINVVVRKLAELPGRLVP
jgi:hypothetical protein